MNTQIIVEMVPYPPEERVLEEMLLYRLSVYGCQIESLDRYKEIRFPAGTKRETLDAAWTQGEAYRLTLSSGRSFVQVPCEGAGPRSRLYMAD